MRGIVSEAILTVGVFVAVGVTLLQLKGVLYGQEKIAKEEVVVQFANDIKSLIERARSVTGDATFVYYPSIKEYKVEIKGNAVEIFDKVTNKNVTLTFSGINIEENVFEDSEIVYVVKTKGKFYILGKCKERGEECFFSLSCCSGYCWGKPSVCQETCAGIGEYAVDSKACCSSYLNESGMCDVSQFCPQERVCQGAPEATEVGGVDCCPEGQICSNGHCCPEGTEWCENPISGGARCISEGEYAELCKESKFKLVFVPVNYGDLSRFESLVDEGYNLWISKSPFNNCPSIVEKVVLKKSCSCSISSNSPEEMLRLTQCIYLCARNGGAIPNNDLKGYFWRIVGIDHKNLGIYLKACGFVSILGDCVQTFNGEQIFLADKDNFMAKVTYVAEMCMPGTMLHELGHTFGLCGTYSCENCDGPIYCGQPTCSEINYPSRDVMYNSRLYNFFEKRGYDYMDLKGIPLNIRSMCG